MSVFFKFFGQRIVQPQRDIFENSKGLSVSHSTSSSFLTKAESETAMATARQHNLIGTHIDAVWPNTSFGCEEAMAGSIVKVPRKWQVVAGVSFDTSNRIQDGGLTHDLAAPSPQRLHHQGRSQRLLHALPHRRGRPEVHAFHVGGQEVSVHRHAIRLSSDPSACDKDDGTRDP